MNFGLDLLPDAGSASEMKPINLAGTLLWFIAYEIGITYILYASTSKLHYLTLYDLLI